MLDFDELGVYRKLPWDQAGVHCNDFGDCFISHPDELAELQAVQSFDQEEAVSGTEMLAADAGNDISRNNSHNADDTDKQVNKNEKEHHEKAAETVKTRIE